MGFRFRKRIKLFPGVWFNLSKSGISTSVGVKGLTVNLKDGKTRTTASIPGTGLSYSEESTGAPDNQANQSDPAPTSEGLPLWVWMLLIVAAVVLLWR